MPENKTRNGKSILNQKTTILVDHRPETEISIIATRNIANFCPFAYFWAQKIFQNFAIFIPFLYQNSPEIGGFLYQKTADSPDNNYIDLPLIYFRKGSYTSIKRYPSMDQWAVVLKLFVVENSKNKMQVA